MVAKASQGKDGKAGKDIAARRSVNTAEATKSCFSPKDFVVMLYFFSKKMMTN